MKSNIIKAKDVVMNRARYITIHIPVIDTGDTSEQKVVKMKEEIDELLNEFCKGPVDTFKALSEMFDVVQVMAGYLLAVTRENILTAGVHDYVDTVFSNGNDLHIRKIAEYAAERKWHVVTR